MCGDDYGFVVCEVGVDGGVLDDGEFFERVFDVEVVVSDYEGVGDFYDFFEIFDGGLVFDFGDDLGFGVICGEKFVEVFDVFGFVDEGEGDEIDVFFDVDEGVGMVFFGE